jgi:alkylated DNA repair dioxygenase AlkB
MMTDLFNNEAITNLLPYEGEVNYYGKVMSTGEANIYLNILLNNIQWKNDEAVIFGKHIITKRKVAWYADTDCSYTYSNTTKQALAWTKELLELKALVEQLTGEQFNSCLLNLYHNGDEGMAWHSDDEKALGKDTSIASLSFGAERKFALKHRATHSLPKSKRILTPRVNLTFRTMVV